MTQTFHRFRASEWDTIKKQVLAKWTRDELGSRPTFKQVREDLPNPHTITPLEWLAMVLLFVLTIFTSFKVGALAVPFAVNSLNVLAQHTSIHPLVYDAFALITAMLFMLLATPSVIYFKLLDREPEIKSEKAQTQQYRWKRRITLEYITPRLPYLVVYVSVAWLVYVSSQLPGTPFEQYLPVVVEVALATLVGNILKKRNDFNAAVYKALSNRTEPYDTRRKAYETDPAYLKLLYQAMREAISHIERLDPSTNKKTRVNAWLEQAEDDTVHRVVVSEYKRLTGGQRFATEILHSSVPELSIVPKTEPIQSTSKLLPPSGLHKWTPDALAEDLRSRGIDPASDYGEKEIARDYFAGYGARSAWRSGGKELFHIS